MTPLNSFLNSTRILPNGGGSYNIANSTPSTMIQPAPVAPAASPSALSRLFSPTPAYASAPSATPVVPTTPTAPVVPTPSAPTSSTAPVNIPQGYVNPATGQLYSAKEIVANMAKKIPLTNAGDIGKYAGDAASAPDKSVADLTTQARLLNNARNDIATGAVDPLKVGKDSGIAYSPAQLNAIEKAYAGIYDPALNDVFTRIKAKQEIDKAAAAAKTEEAKAKAAQELAVFNTNENIRQWKATTGTTAAAKSDFTKTQSNNGASNAGLSLPVFDDLDPDIKNFFINSPKELNPDTNKMVPMYESFANLVKGAKTGQLSPDDASKEIMDADLPDVVKHYFIDQLPLSQPVKEGYFAKLWNAITGQ